MATRRFLIGVSLAIALMLFGPHSLGAVPQGKAWSETQQILPPEFTNAGFPVLGVDPGGRLLMAAPMLNQDPEHRSEDLLVYAWTDTGWVERSRLGQTTGIVRPVESDGALVGLIWNSLSGKVGAPPGTACLITGYLENDEFTRLDSVTVIHVYRSSYAGTVSGDNRWATVGDQVPGFVLRLFVSESEGAWEEVPVVGQGNRGVAAGPINDSDVVLGWTSLVDGMQWGIHDGQSWVRPPERLSGGLSLEPAVKRGIGNNLWMSWATSQSYVELTEIRSDGAGPIARLECDYGPFAGQPHYSETAEMTDGADGRPAVAWSAFNGYTGRSDACICFPTADGWTEGELIAEATDGIPVIAKDRFGDTWVAWWRFRTFTGVQWKHTYTQATAFPFQIVKDGANRRIEWELSELAPGSHWTVLRSRNGETPEAVGTLLADDSLVLSWTDEGPSTGILTYQLRRDSLDRRYELVSEPMHWPVKTNSRHLRIDSANPTASSDLKLTLSGAEPGEITIQLFDVRGRIINTVTVAQPDEAPFQFTLSRSRLGNVGAGIYLVRAEDHLGGRSNAVKFVLLR